MPQFYGDVFKALALEETGDCGVASVGLKSGYLL
jgi:hypothetical protein